MGLFYSLVSALKYTFSPLKDKVRNLTRTPDALAGKEIVVLSNNHEARSGHKTVHTPEEAVEYLRGKGMEEIIVGGGVQTYNVFLDKDLVTDIYFNVTPMVIGDGGTIGSKDDLFVKFDKMNYEPIIENVIRLHLSK